MGTADLVLKMGAVKYEGSSETAGIPYQEIPKLGIPGHRNKSAWRAERIMELVDVKGKSVVDLGCSVGTISSVLALRAKTVSGYDHDPFAIAVAQALYNGNTSFSCADLTLEFAESLSPVDVIIWTSQFMWMVKQRGMSYALDFLWKLSTKCGTLVFETAAKDDGSAPLNLYQEDIFKILCMNTCFRDITDHGPWNDLWSPRNVFVCRNPLYQTTTHWASVTMPKRGIVKKTFSNNEFSKELKVRELLCLKRLQGFGFAPELIDDDEFSITMLYGGTKAKWIPESDVNKIIYGLGSKGIIHRDICQDNLLWNGENVILIDYAFATIGNEITNYHYDLGGRYKCPYGFNDEYSLRKVQKELLCQN